MQTSLSQTVFKLYLQTIMAANISGSTVFSAYSSTEVFSLWFQTLKFVILQTVRNESNACRFSRYCCALL